MSTKIYNGFKIYASSLDEVFLILNSVKSQIIDSIDSYNYSKTLTEFIKIYDKNHLNKFLGFKYQSKYINNPNDNILSNYFNFIFDRSEIQKLTDYKETIKSEIIVYPVKLRDKNGSFYLFQFFGDFENCLKDYDFILEYGYWNNTDKPKNITKYQWEKRKKDWDLAINNYTPISSGISYYLTSDAKFYLYDKFANDDSINKLLDSIQSKLTFETRARLYTNDIIEGIIFKKLLNKYLKSQNLKNNKKNLNNLNYHVYTRFYFQSTDFTYEKLSYSLKKKYNQTLSDISKTIPKYITALDFKKSLNTI